MWLRGHPRVNVAELGPEPGLRLPFPKDRKTLLIRRPTGCAGLARKVLFSPKDEVVATVTLEGTELSHRAASSSSGAVSPKVALLLSLNCLPSSRAPKDVHLSSVRGAQGISESP